MILFDAECVAGVIGGVIKVSRFYSHQRSAVSRQENRWLLTRVLGLGNFIGGLLGQKNAGLKSATLISVSSPVSQVLW
jgi:hypothetical protein